MKGNYRPPSATTYMTWEAIPQYSPKQLEPIWPWYYNYLYIPLIILFVDVK